MILFRVAVQVHDGKVEHARSLFGDLTLASRTVPGVISFDILQDPELTGRFVSIEVYDDQAALDRQADLPELATVMTAFPDLLVDGPSGTIFHVSKYEPWPGA
jgi:quinol monooxygenase YgiN